LFPNCGNSIVKVLWNLRAKRFAVGNSKWKVTTAQRPAADGTVTVHTPADKLRLE
jgi:hypothetical protein